ncbi:hypothetical protein [Pseudomonas chlororaphis]|uniref:hypothetical protein n=1 Tax=Pseudomonas chlororaphis TaxID=587753 RepID=UPI002D79E33C|nr:hypothetical protein [Pseudomonas chlororaphis]
MWWKITLVVLVLTALFFVLGVYAGGALFLLLTGGGYSSVTWHTLLDAADLAWNDRRLVFLPWAWCATAAITFLPIALTLLSYFLRLKPVSSLHGDARFANNKELALFEYSGEYKKL